MTQPNPPAYWQGYIFPNAIYAYRDARAICRYQLRLAHPVQPALLQKALDTVMPQADYFRVRLVWDEAGNPAFVPNTGPCLVYEGEAQRAIPAETGGYLFAISCAGEWVYLDWDHMLGDGRGVVPLVLWVVREYCRLRYGAALPTAPLPSDPVYQVGPLEQAYRQNKEAMEGQKGNTREAAGAVRRTLVQLPLAQLAAAAAPFGAKPVSALLALLCQTVQPYCGGQQLAYSYGVDTRAAMGVPEARYNCVVVNRSTVPAASLATLADHLPALDQKLRASLTPQRMRYEMSRQYGFMGEVLGLKAPLRVKKRVFSMVERACGVTADFWLSYVGYALVQKPSALEPYIREVQLWAPANIGSMGVEALHFGPDIVLCIQDKFEGPSPAQGLCHWLAAAGITPTRVEQLPPLPKTAAAAAMA